MTGGVAQLLPSPFPTLVRLAGENFDKLEQCSRSTQGCGGNVEPDHDSYRPAPFSSC
jgi:hypothetical protein